MLSNLRMPMVLFSATLFLTFFLLASFLGEKFPRSPVFWKCSDYIYFGVAIMAALLGIADQEVRSFEPLAHFRDLDQAYGAEDSHDRLHDGDQGDPGLTSLSVASSWDRRVSLLQPNPTEVCDRDLRCNAVLYELYQRDRLLARKAGIPEVPRRRCQIHPHRSAADCGLAPSMILYKAVAEDAPPSPPDAPR